MSKQFRIIFISLLFLLNWGEFYAQFTELRGIVLHNNVPVPFANIFIGAKSGISSDSNGYFSFVIPDSSIHFIKISAIGFQTDSFKIDASNAHIQPIIFHLRQSDKNLNTVIISEQSELYRIADSPIPTEIYSAQFFKQNPSASLFEGLSQVNGVKPQINCNICNTGDIHINGLEGPYTLILIDGMPIVSGLSTVYGLNGIPQSLIDRVEIVKGPSSTFYGSEAVGGLINVITKHPENVPRISLESYVSSWAEVNIDVGLKFKLGKKWTSLHGINYFNYQVPFDFNKDGFTDLTLQNRVSAFNKWNMQRKNDRIFQIAFRYVYENRWGGELNWNKKYRGGNQIYGESIYTNRWEFLTQYQFPTSEKIYLQSSANGHYQNSAYGENLFNATQFTNFLQLIWEKKYRNWFFTAGATMRYTYYDDDTGITINTDSTNNPQHIILPGIFTQNEVIIKKQHTLLGGIRFDWNSIHGAIFSPRLNYKWKSKNENSQIRMGIGNGFRVAQVFTEDHMALTGSRKVEFTEALKPEKSWNVQMQFIQKLFSQKGFRLHFDISGFYTYFSNKIIADYDTHPQKVIYNNLNGYAISRGIQTNIDFKHVSGISILLGATVMDVWSFENGIKTRPLFTENFSGNWTISYTIPKVEIKVDYTGTVYSPMRLPLQNELDPRRAYSPWWSVQNIQLSKKFKYEIEIFGGIKNLLNLRPTQGNPFLIAGSLDPFNKQVQYDGSGNALANANNPYGLQFDPTYSYAPNQGIRGYLGLRWQWK